MCSLPLLIALSQYLLPLPALRQSASFPSLYLINVYDWKQETASAFSKQQASSGTESRCRNGDLLAIRQWPDWPGRQVGTTWTVGQLDWMSGRGERGWGRPLGSSSRLRQHCSSQRCSPVAGEAKRDTSDANNLRLDSGASQIK